MTTDFNLLPLLPAETCAPGRPLVIAGPCSAESREQTLATARELASSGLVSAFRAGLWKPRTHPGCFEGVGAKGLEWLAEVKAETGLPTAVEVATRAHALAAMDAGVDILWIGARTSADPFAVQDVAGAIAEGRERRGKDVAVMVKNPVSPDLELWIGALQRLYNAGLRRLGAVHRGFAAWQTGLYRNLPVWHIPIELRRRIPGLPVIVDPSHIGGRRDLVGQLARTALDMGFEGLMIESHYRPDEALSDAAQQLTPSALASLLASLSHSGENAPAAETLNDLRGEIDRLDNELIDLLARRMEVADEIGRHKRSHSMSIVQKGRYGQLMEERISQAAEAGLGEDFARAMFEAIHAESVRRQILIYSPERE